MISTEVLRSDTTTNTADEISLTSMVRGIARSRRLIVATSLAFGIAAATYAAVRPVRYTSTAWFKPQVEKQSSAVAGLAAQFGLSIPMGDGAMSAAAYADLVDSREILLPVAEGKYSFTRQGRPTMANLVDLYSPAKGLLPARRDGTISILAKQVKASVSKTGAVVVSVSTSYPELSQQLAARIVAEVDSFNLRNRQSQATPERQFVEQRVAIAQGELHQAEARLEAFLESNRQFSSAPQLQLERERLSRDVAMRQQVYTSLAQTYEQARIDEVRDMPTIIVLERPEVPYAPTPRGIPLMLALGLALGAVLGLFLAFLRDTWRNLNRRAHEETVAATT